MNYILAFDGPLFCGINLALLHHNSNFEPSYVNAGIAALLGIAGIIFIRKNHG
jgi:hypothetical protein